MAKSPCTVCGRLGYKGRCSLHPRPRKTPPTRSVGYTNAERQRRKATVDAWVSVNGYLCPGYQRPPHPSTDLTADHVDPVALNGQGGTLTVLCRRCNGRKGASTSDG